MGTPLISVCLITYDHAEYIQQAIEGVLMQKVKFSWELIIADDCSSDGTREIIIDYKNKYPDFITLLLQEKNVGPAKNWLDLISRPRSKYVAYFEGDDYWTDPYKIQKQVDFLEENLEFVICYHPVEVLFPDGLIEEDYQVKGIIDKSESNINDLAVMGNYIHTPSVVFRNVLDSYPETFKESPNGDYFLWMLLAHHGKIKKLQDVMAVYRHGVGVHSTQSDSFRSNSFLRTLDVLSKTISDKTIVEILRNRILAIKSASLPYSIRALENYGDLTKAEMLKDYVDLGQLVKAIWLKIRRKF